MNIARSTLLLSFCALLSHAQSRPESMHAELQPGPYAVGYRTLALYDTTRPSIGDLTRDVLPQAGKGRPMHVHLWYPAERGTGQPLTYGDYIGELANIVLQPGKGRSADELFSEQIIDLGGDRKLLESNLPKLKQLAVWARREAKPTSARVPLVIFGDYRAPSSNSVMCEYLASQGFAVATVAIKGTFDLPYNTGRSGIETGAEDILFVRAELAKLPTIDVNSTAVMGLGIEASSALLGAMRNPEIKALISLEGGIPTAFEDGLLKQIASYDIAQFRVPLLGIYVDEEEAVDPRFFEQYKYSSRHLFDFKGMREFYFLNYGTLDPIVPGLIGKAPGDTARGFRIAAEYVRRFVNAYLRGSAKSKRELEASPESLGIPAGFVSASVRPAMPEAKSYHELRALIGKDFEQFRAWYNRARKHDPQPIAMNTAAEIFGWLSYTGDSDASKRLVLGRMRVEMYPQSARAHFALAQTMKSKQILEARDHYQQALALLPKDEDPALTDALRKRIQEVSAKETAPAN